MESLRTVISRLFADAQDNQSTEAFVSQVNSGAYYGLFHGKTPKRRRLDLLHPETDTTVDLTLLYNDCVVSFPLTANRIHYGTLVQDFLRTCSSGSCAEQLGIILQIYREPPFTLVKTTRLMTFLHHLLSQVPITPTTGLSGTHSVSLAGQSAMLFHPFPLGQLLEDLLPTLSLRSISPQNPHALSIWIVTLYFMLSCLQSNPPQAVLQAGVSSAVILAVIKHLLTELTDLPATDLSSLQIQCFQAGQKILDFFMLRSNGGSESGGKGGETTNVTSPGLVSFYDVIYSFPELYGHFLITDASVAIPQPPIVNHNLWLITLHYMISSIKQDHRLVEKIPTAIAINIIKHVSREINTLPADLSTIQVKCLNKGKELINLFLLGPSGDGASVVSHYDIIVALPDIYGHFLRGTFAQSIHWTMEKFVNELGKRRRHLAFLMMPPDASWPLISQMSRRHEYNDLTTRTSYHMFEGDLIEFVKDGNSTSIETHFRDMLFQRASMDEFRQLAISLTQTGLDTTQIRKAMVTKVRDVIRCIQHHSRLGKRPINEIEQEPFNPATASARGEDIKMLIPSNMNLWELMTETADQLYSFVAADFFSYQDILQDFTDLVYTPEGEPYPPETKHHLTKDNGLVWLLLQLFYIEKVSTTVIQKDFEGDERLFEKLVRLYNEEQILSKDAFSLRDLSLQCAINHQKAYIKDVTNIKHRHPLVAASLLHAGLCYQIQAYFNKRYHSNVPKDSTLFCNLDLQEMSKIAMESQLRQDVVPYTLYVYLVPTNANVSTLGKSGTTYVKGGTLGYTLLDLLSINAKHRFLQVIYKMMLDSELGPRYQGDVTPAITCVPPHVLDVVYKLLYSAPCSAELMIKEIFEKLRRCDKLIKMTKSKENEGTPTIPFPDQTMRWLHTILQLMNYRFIRFLKYPFYFDLFRALLLHHIKYSISYLEHRQVYHVLESFAANVMRMQIDGKVLRSLDDSSREKPIWFAESEILARIMVSSICRLIHTRGQADIKTEQIHRVLSSLYEYRLEWSSESLQYFPEAVKSFYMDTPDSPNQSIPLRPAVHPIKLQQLLSSNKAYSSYLLQGTNEYERFVVQYFSSSDNRPSLLCTVWMMSVMRKSTDALHMPSVRKLLLLIPPAKMATFVIDLIEFILNTDHASNIGDMTFVLLNNMIWKHQWLNFNHVIFALVKGSGTPERFAKAFRYVRQLLVDSTEFSKRVAKWDSLKFNPRHWAEEDFNEKFTQYLDEFPEYFEFEAFAMKGYEQTQATLDPPLQTPMPIYLTNVISDFIPLMEALISRLIEHAQTDLLIDVLDKTSRDPRICKRILKLLDYDQYDIAPEAIRYSKADVMENSLFDASYFERVIFKLTGNLQPQRCAPRTSADLPERHFREMGNPAVMGILIATLEILLTPIPPTTITKYILDMVLLRKPHYVGVSALTIHAIGLLMSSLPSDKFLRPIWQELSHLMITDPYLLEVSEPCQLIRCGIPKRSHGKYVMSQSLPDFSTTATLKDSMSARLRKAMVFPYIFNDYTFNFHNYSTNAPNTFLTLSHSILHYSSLDAFGVFLEYMRSLRSCGKLQTDVQLLYICAFIGPTLHRIEKLDSTESEFLVELMHMVKQVTTRMDMKDGWSTQALEQVFDFLHHIRARFVKSTEITSQIRDIIKSMTLPTSHRLSRLVM
ncbi:mediator complex subunit 23-domain-containing protein [Spinellus fusiger]|nr:mediator complex subunit 23-domain-containing protein [Spinellus fusiger]